MKGRAVLCLLPPLSLHAPLPVFCLSLQRRRMRCVHSCSCGLSLSAYVEFTRLETALILLLYEVTFWFKKLFQNIRISEFQF